MMQGAPRMAASANFRHGSVPPAALLKHSKRSQDTVRVHRPAVRAIATSTEATFDGSPGRPGTIATTTAASNGADSHRSAAAEQPSYHRSAEHSSWGATSTSAREQVLEETADWLRGELPSMFQTGVREMQNGLLQCQCLTSALILTWLWTQQLNTRERAGSQNISAHIKVHLLHTSCLCTGDNRAAVCARHAAGRSCCYLHQPLAVPVIHPHAAHVL